MNLILMYIRILSIINVSTSWRTIEICFKSKFCKIPFCEYKIAETINETMFKCKSNLIHVFKTLLVVPYSECLKIPLSCCWSTSILIIKVINWIWIHGIINEDKMWADSAESLSTYFNETDIIDIFTIETYFWNTMF